MSSNPNRLGKEKEEFRDTGKLSNPPKSESQIDLSKEREWLKEAISLTEIPPKIENSDMEKLDKAFQELRKRPGMLYHGLLLISGISDVQPNKALDDLQVILAQLDTSTLATFMQDVFTFAYGLDAIKKNEKSVNVGFTLRNETIMEAAFDRLPLAEREELALLIGKMERDNRIEQKRLDEAPKETGIKQANGLFVPTPIKREIKPATAAEERILLLIRKANRMPEPQPSPRAAPSTPSPSGASASIAMHAAQALPQQSAIPTPAAPQPRYNQEPEYRRGGPQYFQPPAAPKPPVLVNPKKILEDVAAKKKKDGERAQIVNELETYKTKIDADLKNGKEYDDHDIFKLGVSKKWKQAAVEKVLTHLENNYSIENLELAWEYKIALEDGRLKEIALKIPGYDVAIANAKAPPSPGRK